MALSPQQTSLFHQKEAEMVSSRGGNHIVRSAHFLQPSFGQTRFGPPPKVTPTKPVSALAKFYPKVHFNGWRSAPPKDWVSWVEKMRVLYENKWRQAGVYDAIMSSKLEVPKCFESVFSVAEKWCPETSSFVFRWGEASITLEDVMVLGSYSVTGESVLTELSSKKLLAIEEELLVKRSALCRTKHKKATQHKWMEEWIDTGSESEHAAFLSLWLSRFVLPADDLSTINKSAFPLAVLLSKGVKIALAPAVLASIYRDLRLLKKKIETLRRLGDSDFKDVPGVTLWAPLQLFQAWIWERFPKLSPSPSFITDGLRLKKWNKVKVTKNNNLTRALDSGGGFVWRPYSEFTRSWMSRPNLYPETGKFVWPGGVEADVGFDIEAYVRCVRTSKLIGLEKGCVEKYFPHRVSMQFGLDQDIPMAVPCLSDYNRPIGDVLLYVPQRLFESDVTVEYLKWRESKGSLKASSSLTQTDAPPGLAPRGKRAASGNPSDSPWSKRPTGSSHPIRTGNQDGKRVESDDDLDDSLTISEYHQRSTSSTPPVIDLNSPIPSAGDDVCSQDVATNAGETQEIGCRVTGLTLEARMQFELGSTSQSPECSVRREAAPNIGVSERPEMDLEDKIARMHKVLDRLKVILRT